MCPGLDIKCVAAAWFLARRVFFPNMGQPPRAPALTLNAFRPFAFFASGVFFKHGPASMCPGLDMKCVAAACVLRSRCVFFKHGPASMCPGLDIKCVETVCVLRSRCVFRPNMGQPPCALALTLNALRPCAFFARGVFFKHGPVSMCPGLDIKCIETVGVLRSRCVFPNMGQPPCAPALTIHALRPCAFFARGVFFQTWASLHVPRP